MRMNDFKHIFIGMCAHNSTYLVLPPSQNKFLARKFGPSKRTIFGKKIQKKITPYNLTELTDIN